MKRLINILTVLLLTAFTAHAQTEAAGTAKGKPDIEFAKTSHDFGSLNSNGRPVTASFQFTNTGDAPLIIVTASASCGCTKPTFSPQPIMPGEKSEISVTFDPKGKRGEFDKTVTVRTNIKSKRRVVLHLTGVIIPPHK